MRPVIVRFLFERARLVSPADIRSRKAVPAEISSVRAAFPRPLDRLAFEVVAEAPVAEHLEERVVVRVEADVFEVVVLAASADALLRVGGAWLYGSSRCPRKIGTNWFMPALVNSSFGASGRSEDDGTMVCCFSRKKSRNDCRISADVMGNHE